ncbi:MAG: HAMP domain-containing protein [Chloroflexi bacterium]|nr:MAG: HAMP domain-containing protein [Chloroflexota bacterium]
MFAKMRIGVKLFLSSLLAAVVPIVIIAIVIGVLVNGSVRSMTDSVKDTRTKIEANIIGEYLKDEAVVTANQIDAYLSERINDVAGWAASPLIRQAAIDASKLAEKKGLTGLTESEQEDRMAETKELLIDPKISGFLTEQMSYNPVFSEVFFTDDHGFIVSHTKMTTDFAQKGEDWWDQAWAKGSYIGQVAYDESSKVQSIDIAVRIIDSFGKPIGVMKAVLDVHAVQYVGLNAADRTKQGAVRIFSRDGFLISDTTIKNDPSLIMQDEGNLIKKGWSAVQKINNSSTENGFLLNEADLQNTPVILGYAQTAPGDFYKLPGFEGFNWYVTVEQPAQVALETLNGLDQEMTELEVTRATINGLFMGISGVCIIVAIFVTYLVSRGIVRPINTLAAAAERFSAGDMDVTVAVRNKDEIGILEKAFQEMIERIRGMLLNERNEREYMEQTVQQYLEFMQRVRTGNLKDRLELNGHQRPEQDPLVRLGRDLNELTGSLHQMILQVQDAANQLASTSNEILAATTQQAGGASEQSAAISQTTTTVDEVRTIAEVSSMRAQEVADSARQTVQISRTGQASVEETISSMGQIKEQVERIAENILELSEQMQQIGEIITSVSKIAAQSNMLALNASVEAARAGENGRGFAVVAAEVRSLSEQSRQATAQIKAILQDIQKAANTTVMATEEGTKGVEIGIRLAVQARTAIEQLSAVIDQSAQNAVQMVAAGQQQTSGVEQVAMAMRNINQATMQSLASTRQAEKAAQNLNELARLLTETVNQYEV